MGKGIAVSFKKRWPNMYSEYRQRCISGEFGLGDVLIWEEDGVMVFNLGTQVTWRARAQLWAIEQGLIHVIRECELLQIAEVALPRIGSGLGGLEWSVVRSLMMDIGSRTQVKLRVCENFIEGKPLTV